MSKFNFEEAYNRLETIVKEMESVKDLEKSLALYEEGLRLISQCKKRLSAVANQVEVIKAKFNEESPS